MADLSGVLRKTIDGLPRATPAMREKVYQKARAAIQRQIQAADPPLAQDIVDARLAALEDAIAGTEAHYEGEAADGGETPPDVAAPPAQPAQPVPQRDAPEPERRPAPPPPSGQPGRPMPRAATFEREAGDQLRAASASNAGGAMPAPATREVAPGFKQSSQGPGGQGASSERRAPPIFPAATETPKGEGARPPAVGAPFIAPSARGAQEDWDEPIPADIRVDDDIPEADVSAPRSRGRRKARGGFGSLAAGIVVLLLLAGLGTVGWLYRDSLQGMLVAPGDIGTVASGGGESATGGNEQAAASPEGVAGTAGKGGVTDQQTASAEGTPNGQANGSTRRFTQRLLPDGTEVDEGPAKPASNAFDEGTNIAAASPVPPEGVTGGSPTVQSEIGQNPTTVGGASQTPAGGATASTPSAAGATDTATADKAATSAGAAPAGDAASSGSETAAAQPDKNAPEVAQDAVFYQERTDSAPGTQESGNVVWSVVNEPPSDGLPAEPAIRAKVDVPDENLKLTMTIRRNADPTLPASHVIELMFDVPSNFQGGSIANVQRLALKDTEQARGEPLIGVAGKISDNFFIIALNNLDQAVQSNLALMQSEQWIDIPIAYATGRRALMSIEKGIPGDRAFKKAMEAWQAKT